MFLSKYSEESFQKSVQPAARKCFVWKFLRFSEKIWGLKFSDFCQKIYQKSYFFDRTKPWSLIKLNMFTCINQHKCIVWTQMHHANPCFSEVSALWGGLSLPSGGGGSLTCLFMSPPCQFYNTGFIH